MQVAAATTPEDPIGLTKKDKHQQKLLPHPHPHAMTLLASCDHHPPPVPCQLSPRTPTRTVAHISERATENTRNKRCRTTVTERQNTPFAEHAFSLPVTRARDGEWQGHRDRETKRQTKTRARFLVYQGRRRSTWYLTSHSSPHGSLSVP